MQKKRLADTLQITRFTENRIEGKISPNARKLLFFSIPYDRGWSAKIDGKPADLYLCNIGFIGMTIEPGPHKIELSYLPVYFYQSMLVSILGLLIFTGAIFGRRFRKS